mgnify:CR=1 FL=1
MPPAGLFMLIFAGAILLYAALLAITKDYKMLPYRARVSVKPKNPEKYTVQLAKAIALCALAPACAAFATIWNEMFAGIIFIVVLVLGLICSTKIVKDEE